MSSLINKVLFTRAGYGLTVLRIAVGVIFAAHGSQKLFGLFGGYGLAGTAQYMDSIGLHPGYLMATLAGGTEFFAGLALDHRPAGTPGCTGSDLLVAGGDLHRTHQQRSVYGQQRLRVCSGPARWQPRRPDRRRRQALGGPRHRRLTALAQGKGPHCAGLFCCG
jgi:hypothetical protein